MNIKEAADNLLSRNEITTQQHETLVKIAFNPLKSKLLLKGLAKFKGFRSDLSTAGVKIYKDNPFLAFAALGAGGAIGKELIADPITQAVKIRKSFNTMIEKTPQLAEADQGKLRDYFGVVKAFSPKAASNPLVAGSLVNKMLQFEGVDHKLVQDIAALQAGMPAPRYAPIAAEQAAKSITSLPKKEIMTIAATPTEIGSVTA